MKIKLITISKQDDEHAHELASIFAKRLQHYTSFEMLNLKPLRGMPAEQQKKSEAGQLLKKISAEDELILLDEKGKEWTSVQFASFISKKMNAGTRSLCFVIGGAYGFDKEISDKADSMISLSKMTLPHQLAKVIFTEQLYRAFTIIRNEGYHHS